MLRLMRYIICVDIEVLRVYVLSILWGRNSAGRVAVSKIACRGFEPHRLHHYNSGIHAVPPFLSIILLAYKLLFYCGGDTMEIKDKFITQKKYHQRRPNQISYIVIHDTGNTGVGQDQLANFKWFNDSPVESSQQFIVDDHQILRIMDEQTCQAWHVGDGKGKYGITNTNSIGIEICINRDGNYEKQVASAAELQVYLQKKYNVPIERIVRHYDQSRKNCPASMSKNNWQRWEQFKQQVKQLW